MARLHGVSDKEALQGNGGWDAIVLVAPDPASVRYSGLASTLERAGAVDSDLGKPAPAVLPVEGLAGGRLVIADTGELTREHDDVRRFADAAKAAVRRARDAGSVAPLLLVAGVPDDDDFANALAVAALGALGGLWQPLEAREARGADVCEPVERVGVAQLEGASGWTAPDEQLCSWINAVEGGRRLARDLCGTEPERMAAPAFAEHCKTAFVASGVEVDVVDDQEEIAETYPLIAAVARASMPVARHRPRIVRLSYTPDGPIETTLLFAGKGVTYDTGGADIKAGGVMAGMSRDKGGAAAVAGFVLAVASLQPKGVRVIAELGLARNSIGADSFVTDEIITSHAGVRVRIGNTDAEGRLVLADLLSHLRARAASESNAHLFSVATLTGHAYRAVGTYNIAIDNRPARSAEIASRLAVAGDRWGDPFEVSRLRREDWHFVRPRTKADDVLSCNNASSSATARGHQFPMAFLAIASGLAEHGHRDAQKTLAYTHIDIGGSAVEDADWQHGQPTATPIVALMAAFIR